MDNIALFLDGVGWSALCADRFFTMFFYAGASLPDGFMRALSVMRFFGATVFVALLAWYVTKRMTMSRTGARAEGNLAVVESVGVGGQAVVRIVKAADKHFVIGVTKERVTLLGEIDGEKLVERAAADLTSPFGKILARYIQPRDESKEENSDG